MKVKVKNGTPKSDLAAERASLKKLVPSLYESAAKKRARNKRLIALFKTPLFTDDVEEQRASGKALMDALNKAQRRR